MRHTDPGGRFDIPFEQRDILRGIDGDLRAPVGQRVDWIEFDPEASGTDNIYDVADQIVGRQWKEPFRIPAFSAVVLQGPTPYNPRGFYNTDTLRVSVAMNLMEQVFPEILWRPDAHIKDRILYRGQIYVPYLLAKKGLLRNHYTIFTIDANQQNPEEYVNDPQLLEWVSRDAEPPMPFAPQRIREQYGTVVP